MDEQIIILSYQIYVEIRQFYSSQKNYNSNFSKWAVCFESMYLIIEAGHFDTLNEYFISINKHQNRVVLAVKC